MESSEGEGSIFSFNISVKNLTEEDIRDLKTAEAPKPSEKGTDSRELLDILGSDAKVLLAEDNKINQKVALMMLKRIGLKADLAVNGEEAWQMAGKSNHALILMDIQMPKMDGLDSARNILRDLGENAPPIIALTAKSSDQDKKIAKEAGMTDYLTKPLDRKKLLSAIQHVLANPNSSVP